MKNKSLQFCDTTIHPGEHASLALPLPELFSCAPLYMPIKVIQGRQAGPCLLIVAAMHGNELNGTEIINRLWVMKSMKRLHGTLILVPVVNVYGLINRSSDLPGGVRLDRCFPGAKAGTHAARMAHLIAEELIEKADICIDLQTGPLNHSNLPHLGVFQEQEEATELAKAFNAPVVSTLESKAGTLSRFVFEKEKLFLSYEAGEAMRFDEHAIRVGMRGVINVMKSLNMLPKRTSTAQQEKKLKSFFTEKEMTVYASTSGISYSSFDLGQFVQKGETLCVVRDPFGATESETIVSPEDAVIVGKNNLPLVHEGETLFQLAVFPRMRQAASHLEDWQEKSEENLATQTEETFT